MGSELGTKKGGCSMLGRSMGSLACIARKTSLL